MKIEQRKWTKREGWTMISSGDPGHSPQLVLIFAAPDVLRAVEVMKDVRAFYPKATIAGCSTAGEIIGTRVVDESAIVTALELEHTAIAGLLVESGGLVDSWEAGKRLAREIPRELEKLPLTSALLFSEGLGINGADFLAGLSSELPREVTVTGGMAGDSGLFKETWVTLNERIERNKVVAVGFYGSRLKIGIGTMGGWDPFGPERLVTRSVKNVLYELDSRPALALYKQYLGQYAEGLPGTGFFFPLHVRAPGEENGVIRTFLEFDEKEQCMTFSGNIKAGSYVRMAKSNAYRLVDGAASAARGSLSNFAPDSPQLAILVSCVARRILLKQRVEEEIEAVRQILGEKTAMTGFYSYGEWAPQKIGAACELHNQTMTITTLAEV